MSDSLPTAGGDGEVEGTAPPDGDDRGAETPPGPDGLPLLGSTVPFVRDPLGFVDELREHGDVVAYRAVGERFVAVFRPDLVEAVLVSRNDEFPKGEFETSFGELVAPEGVVFTEGERWRRQRRMLQSSFAPDRIRSYADGMTAEAAALADGWSDGEVVELGEALSTYTLRTLARTLFDLAFDDDRSEVVRRATRALSTCVTPEQFAIQRALPSWVPTPARREYERAMDDLTELVFELVAERRAADADGDDLLSALATAEYPDGSRMSPEVVRDQLVTFLFAGHETTATALTFACWLLGDDPTARRRLEREVEAVCGDRDPRFDDLPELEYADAVAREAMRLYPPATELYREPREPTTLGGYRLPADATLQLSAYGIQRDERWWAEPERFRPERWLDADDDRRPGTLRTPDERPEYAYFPFGGGPRHCLGMRFATTELALALATFARRVAFDSVDDSLSPSVGLTLDPGPVEVRVRRR